MTSRKKLQGQVAIITGASRGLGLAAAALLVQAGADVSLVARSEDQVTAEAKRLAQDGGRTLGIAADVSDPEQVEQVVDRTLSQFGRIDILVNNAAIVWPIDEIGEADPDEWAYNIHVNLIGPFYLVHAVLPGMIDQRYGRIVNVSSGLSSIPYAGLSAYGAAKAGLDQFTRILALEVKDAGITANSLYPGMLDTDMQADIRSVDTGETALDFAMFHQAYDAGRLVSTQEAARLVYWLVGPWGRNHTGEIFSSSDESWLAQVKQDLGTQL